MLFPTVIIKRPNGEKLFITSSADFVSFIFCKGFIKSFQLIAVVSHNMKLCPSFVFHRFITKSAISSITGIVNFDSVIENRVGGDEFQLTLRTVKFKVKVLWLLFEQVDLLLVI